MKDNNSNVKAFDIRGLVPLLMVFDMPASLYFYRDILGFEIVNASVSEGTDRYGWVLLSLNGTELMLNTLYEDDSRPGAPETSRLEIHADTSLYFGCPDVDAVFDHLRSKGIEAVEPIITGYGFKALYVKDPDGYMLVFQWPVE